MREIPRSVAFPSCPSHPVTSQPESSSSPSSFIGAATMRCRRLSESRPLRHFWRIAKLISRGEEKLPNTCMNVIKKKREEVDACSAADVDVRWRVLKGKNVDTSDCGGLRTLLSKVVAIFHDCFDTIIEIVAFINRFCKRSLKTQDFHGMYCAILTVNQVVVSAGIFRIFGEEVAELPLVATSKDSQGQQNKFRNDYPLIIFKGTSMLQKKVPKYSFVGKSAEGCEIWGIICANFKIGEAGKVVLTIENPTSKKKKLFYRLKTKPNSSACQTLSC
ncbi:hypothetical protein Q3G72_008899 [Acer saccharum]|nr:hypothetical protein Q3G72_008899 [Acer saccharum]